MTTVALAGGERRSGARLWGGAVASFGAVSGVAPHVLHHVGPLAGAALLAGFAGQALFFVLGLALSVPMLRKLYRRFQTPLAPAIAVLAFAAVFTLSSVVVAPRLTDSDAPATSIEQPDHGHHPEGATR